MGRIPVKSSNIAEVGYFEADQILEVHFHTGSTYRYPGVSKAEFDELVTAKSVGGYFAANIKSKYQHEKVS